MTVWKSVRNAVSQWRAGRKGRTPGASGVNVHQAERALCLAAGAALIVDALRRDGLPRAVSGGLAIALVWRGITGHSRLYASLGVATSDVGRAAPRRDRTPEVPERHGVTLHTSMVIDRPLEDVFTMWRNLETVAERMTHIESVEVTSPTTSRWVARGPFGFRAQWDAEIVEDIENERIAWRSLPGSDVIHLGALSFERAPQDRTVLHVHLKYAPKGGAVGAWVTKLFGRDPSEQIYDDLLRFKDEVEGRPPRGPLLH
jgi:uncharacterized membrane protein